MVVLHPRRTNKHNDGSFQNNFNSLGRNRKSNNVAYSRNSSAPGTRFRRERHSVADISSVKTNPRKGKLSFMNHCYLLRNDIIGARII